MKIKPRSLTGEVTSSAQQTDDAAAIRLKQEQAQTLKKQTQILQGEDTVSIELARSISNEFNPDAIAAERRKKVEDLKVLIAAGKYNPSSEAVAERLAEEISLEILGATTSNS